MKLIFCPNCWDCRKIGYERTECTCGGSYGWYHEDGHHATIGGDAIPVGLDNHGLAAAIVKRGESIDVQAWTQYGKAAARITFEPKEKGEPRRSPFEGRGTFS